MLFSSLVFLWFFLPVVFLGCRLLPPRGQNALLLCASLLFYAWGGPRYLVLMLFSITLNYLGGLAIAAAGQRWRPLVLGVALCANLLLLGYFKYYTFVADALAAVAGGPLLPAREIALPIGISFYTFQAMSYLIDLYRQKIAVQRSWPRLALYVALFPQLIAGPIVQYNQVAGQLGTRTITPADTAYGIKRFLYGLAKKVVLANAFAAKADEIFGLAPAAVSTPLAWLGALYYTLQIYYDFSGYSDMAIGLGRLFGFHFPENFNYPYLSCSVSEFWRRWHMTLSGWFRDYLYIPLGGNRKGMPRTLLNLFIVFLVTGLWHGANWQFVAWGVYYGILLILERLFLGKLLQKLPRAVGWLYTAACFVCGWVIFRAPGLNAGVALLRRMLLPTPGSVAYPVLRYLDARTLLLLAVALLLCGPLQALWPRLRRALYSEATPGPAQTAALLGLGFASMMLLVSSTYNPFIYFRF
ncbi:MAG: MBOAT family protein [Gemmiger sp.]|nr:MBOAT family protein [Gemmiger sp.]